MIIPSDIKLILSLAINPGSSGYKMHNAGYKHLGLDYLYLPRYFNGDIKDALDAIRKLEIHGSSITMPYKINAIKYIDIISETGKKVGSINTILNKNRILYGYNTDAPASITLLKEKFKSNINLLIIGSGGMARSFAYASKKLKLESIITSRNEKKGLSIAKEFDLKFVNYNDLSQITNCVICNALPMNLYNQKSFDQIKKIKMQNNIGVFDAVISKEETWLINQCKFYKLPYVDGNQLSIEQAQIQFEIYTGKKIPKIILKNALI